MGYAFRPPVCGTPHSCRYLMLLPRSRHGRSLKGLVSRIGATVWKCTLAKIASTLRAMHKESGGSSLARCEHGSASRATCRVCGLHVGTMSTCLLGSTCIHRWLYSGCQEQAVLLNHCDTDLGAWQLQAETFQSLLPQMAIQQQREIWLGMQNSRIDWSNHC